MDKIVSLNEIKYNKNPNWGILTPREVLQNLIDKIDNNEVKPTDLLIGFFEAADADYPDGSTTFLTAACSSRHMSWALISRIHQIMHMDN